MDFFNNIQKALAAIAATVTGITGAIAPVATSPSSSLIPSPTPTVVLQNEMITRSGQYSYAGQSVKYTLSIPKNGGETKGDVSGFCEGSIRGDYEGREGGIISGSFSPSCGIAFLRQSLNITYSGNLYLQQGRADLNWEGNIPTTPGKGSFTLNFEPAN